jgi:hypothetical protein
VASAGRGENGCYHGTRRADLLLVWVVVPPVLNNEDRGWRKQMGQGRPLVNTGAS